MSSFYKGKKVFVTGHTGFKGAWLSQILISLGAEVKGVSLAPNTEPSLYNLLDLGSKMQSVFADIRDGERLKKELTSFNPDIVFHLAAQPLVRLSYSEPALTFETNIMGTVNLLEAVRANPATRCVVNITSDKCYDNKETATPYKETDPMGGYDPYSASKGMMELLCASYRNSFFNPKDYGTKHATAVATARAGNVIGGGDYALDRIVPDCARAISQNKEVVLRSPKATRPWQHVLEPLYGYLFLAEKMWTDKSFAQGWNFGPDSSGVQTVEELVKVFISAWGKGSYRVEANAALHEAKLLHLDITKVKTVLGWLPVYTFEQAAAQTALWYKAFYDGADIKEFTLKQIKEYQDNIKWNTF